MIIKNFTPHVINIIDESSVISKPEIRKLVSETENPKIIMSIPSDGMLSVNFEMQDGEPINGIPVRIKKRVGIEYIPTDCDIAIVSALYASASDDKRCHTVIDPVFNVEGKTVIGCLAIGKVES